MSVVYDRINALCKEKGINITVLCREAGISRSVLGDFHAGRTKQLKQDTLLKIANYFNVSTDYILNGTENAILTYDNRVDAEVAEALLNNDDLYDIFFLLKDADPEFIEKALEILKVLTNYEKKE